MVEHSFRKAGVIGSNPIAGSIQRRAPQEGGARRPFAPAYSCPGVQLPRLTAAPASSCPGVRARGGGRSVGLAGDLRARGRKIERLQARNMEVGAGSPSSALGVLKMDLRATCVIQFLFRDST